MCRATVYLSGQILLSLLLLAGCVTTQDRFERAFEAEQHDDPYRAARAYAEVLRRDPDFRDARVRFERTSREAVDYLYERATTADEAGRPEEAVAALDDLAALRALAAGFDVALDLPADFDSFYDAASEAAVRDLMTRADDDAARHRYADADRRYEHAFAYRMPSDLRDELDRRRVNGLLAWADHVAAHGSYRRAYDLAARVRAYDPRPDADVLRSADLIQEEALEAGTEVVVFLPVLAAETAEQVPAYWPNALSSLLSDRHWSAPPLFVAAVPPRDLRRELGRMGRRNPFTRSEAVGIGRALDADLVFVPELRTFARTEQNRRETARTIRTRDGRDTTYTDVRATLRLEAEVYFRVIETTTRNVVGEGTVPASVSGDVRYATFDGDVSILRFPSTDVRERFDRDERRRVEADLEAELQEMLAARLAESVFRKVVDFVP